MLEARVGEGAILQTTAKGYSMGVTAAMAKFGLPSQTYCVGFKTKSVHVFCDRSRAISSRIIISTTIFIPALASHPSSR